MNMEFEQVLRFNLCRWHRNILNSYWLVLCVTIVTESVIYRVELRAMRLSLFFNVLLPILVLTLIIGTIEVLSRYFRDDMLSRALILGGEAIALVLSLANLDFPYVAATFVLPIWVSLFYFEPQRVFRTTATSVGWVACIIVIDELTGHYIDTVGIVTILGIILGGSYLASHITARAVEMLKHLKSTMEANQDLLIQKVMVESASKLDGLTGTYNHKSFHEHIGGLLQQFSKMDGVDIRLYLLITDIDDFKMVNDAYGHQAGDIVLKRVSDGIRHHCLANDFLARYGGEEFALILVDRTRDEAIHFGESLCQSVAALHHPEIDGQKVTISAGLARYHSYETKDDFFNAADAALYQAKQRGKNQLVFAEESQPVEWDEPGETMSVDDDSVPSIP